MMPKKASASFLLLLTFLFHSVDCGKIMFYAPMISKSVEITFMPLAEELASRGHSVTVVTPFAQKKTVKNLEIIHVKSRFEQMTSEMSGKVLRDDPTTTSLPIFEMLEVAEETNDNALGHPQLRKYTDDPNTKFDVVIVFSMLMDETGFYLAHRFDASLVLYLSTQVSISFMDFAVGQPHNPAYLPLVLLDYQTPMTFIQRVVNTVATACFHLFRNYLILSKADALLDKHFPGVSRPALLDLERNASLAFTFGHPFLTDGLRPVSPNFHYVGMMNCRAPEPLPKDLQQFLDSANDTGVIYVSFGSILQASEMSEKTRKTLLNVFKRLDQKILWKWETEVMEDKPDNVKLSKWLPQQDVLAHRNTRLFVTHGGQSSMQESLCHQKPMVVVSVLADQHANGRESERIGCGIALPFTQLTEDKLYSAIRSVLDDPEYSNRAREHGSLLTDEINRPLDRAVWWVEFLLRHPGRIISGLPCMIWRGISTFCWMCWPFWRLRCSWWCLWYARWSRAFAVEERRRMSSFQKELWKRRRRSKLA